MRMISYESLFQMDFFLQAVFLHYHGEATRALELYTASLQQSGMTSDNLLRLAALENIAMIVSEKQEYEAHLKQKKAFS